jgi:hypothetical protein
MLGLLLAAFIAMHGVAATDGDGTHQPPLALRPRARRDHRKDQTAEVERMRQILASR